MSVETKRVFVIIYTKFDDTIEYASVVAGIYLPVDACRIVAKTKGFKRQLRWYEANLCDEETA